MSEDQQALKNKGFFISPIGAEGSEERRHADWVMELGVKPAFAERDWSILRADEMAHPGRISPAIFKQILNAEICVADLSYLNPNVMYELGVRHALQRPVIQIASQGTKLPFDAAQQNTIFFDPRDVSSIKTLQQQISEQIEWIIGNPDEVSNPITLASAFEARVIKADSTSALLLTLSNRLAALESREDYVAPAIVGQGELATKNVNDLRDIWKVDNFIEGAKWEQGGDGRLQSNHKGFVISLAPQPRGRWASTAIETETNYSVTYPSWQPSIEAAKLAIAKNIVDYIAQKQD